MFSNDIHACSPCTTGGCPVEKRKSLVLDNSEVECSGDEGELRQLCPMVESIYLSSNHLTHWTDVSQSLLVTGSSISARTLTIPEMLTACVFSVCVCVWDSQQ